MPNVCITDMIETKDVLTLIPTGLFQIVKLYTTKLQKRIIGQP